LRAVLIAGARGVPGAELAEKLGLKPGRGLSGISSMLHRVLPDYGFSFDEVLKIVRKRGSSVWRRGPKLADAIEKIEKGGGA